MNRIYLDNAATTPISDNVLKVMNEVMKNNFGNPSSTHSFGRDSKSIIELTRKNIAKELKIKSNEVYFTSGGTESNNMIFHSAINFHGVQRIISTKIEHKAVLKCIDTYCDNKNIDAVYLSVDETGKPDLKELEDYLTNDNKKTLVSLMHINNEIGTIIDLKLVGEICKKYNSLFHSDTVQTIGHYFVDLENTYINYLTCSAHKFHGPKGVGFAVALNGAKLVSFIEGGEQERGCRAGTESVHNIAGLNQAFNDAYINLENRVEKIKSLKNYFIKSLGNKINFKINGDVGQSSDTILNLQLPVNIEKKSVLNFKMDIAGIACSAGSACQSGSDKPSHVLLEILDKKEIDNISLRFSFSHYNTKKDIDYVIEFLESFVIENQGL